MDRVDYQPLLIQDLVTWNRNGELDLAPWYQRRAVWTTAQKAYLVNTLFERKPVPTLYFRHAIDLDADKTVREVVDGQQRIRAVLEYLANEYAARHPQHPRRLVYSKLTRPQQEAFRETALSGGWLLGATDQDVIEVFGRLNSVSKTLNASESRNAKYGGEFKQFCLRHAANRVAMWRDLNIFTANDIARMLEVQFLADLCLNLMHGLSDYSAARLNNLYKDNDDEFEEADYIERRLERCFARVAELPKDAIFDTIFRRQPVFFSLIVVLDSRKSLPASNRLATVLREVDARYNSDVPLPDRPPSDAAFYEACRASTQRLKNRRTRHDYIASFL